MVFTVYKRKVDILYFSSQTHALVNVALMTVVAQNSLRKRFLQIILVWLWVDRIVYPQFESIGMSVSRLIFDFAFLSPLQLSHILSMSCSCLDTTCIFTNTQNHNTWSVYWQCAWCGYIQDHYHVRTRVSGHQNRLSWSSNEFNAV